MKKLFIRIISLALVLITIGQTLAFAGEYAPACDASCVSIVDALSLAGEDCSFTRRAQLAQINGIVNNATQYEGTMEQNKELLNLMKAGMLKLAEDSDENEETSSSSASSYTCSSYAECTSDDSEIYIITKENAPIRKEPNNKGEIVARAQKGQLISVKRVFWTLKLARWCEINVIGSNDTLYVHIDNCSPHTSHSFINLYSTQNGTIDFCAVCGLAFAEAKDSASCNLVCVADHAVKGSFSSEADSFASVAAQVLVGEIPWVGTAADLRDVIGDIMVGESGLVIAADMVAFIPLIGALKFTDDVAMVAKHTDELAAAAKKADIIPWGKWDDYAKVTRNGNEYAEIGDFYYTRHAVDEFLNPSIETNQISKISDSGKTSWVEHSRGVPPTYANWVLTEGVENGTTMVSAPYIKNGATRQDFTNGTLKIVVEGGDTVVTIITK